MCANYETISKDRVHLLDLFEFIFRHTWKNSQFALIPVDTIYEQNTSRVKCIGMEFTVKIECLLLLQHFMKMY